MQMLATIGYEGSSIDDFIRTLKIAKISKIIDVREIAQSRRPGFSKNILANELSKFGIDYVHFKALGDPKHGREAARSGRMTEFREIYTAHMERPEGLEALRSVAEVAQCQTSALLCFERSPKHCHRSMIADKLSVLYTFRVVHLGVVQGNGARVNSGAFGERVSV